MKYLQTAFLAAGIAALPATQASASISFDPSYQQVEAIEGCAQSDPSNIEACVLTELSKQAIEMKQILQEQGAEEDLIEYYGCLEAHNAIVLSEHYAIALQLGYEGSFEVALGSQHDFDAMIEYFRAHEADPLNCSVLYPEPEVSAEDLGLPDYSDYTVTTHIQDLIEYRQQELGLE